MPDELFDIWLQPLIDVYGWPFQSVSDDVQSGSWKYRLSIDHSLLDWYSAQWERVDIPYSDLKLRQSSIDMVQAIIGHCALGLETVTANIENTNKRFLACASFIRDNGCVPLPLVLIYRGERFLVMD